jgi:hypothetical protein
MLKDISWKLKSSECSSMIAFENLSRIVILCGFQNIWSFLVFVTISIHSWLLFTLIACWLAISEEMSLKSIISFSWIKFLEYPLSQLKSSKLVQRCMNWKDIVISSILFLRWYGPMWIISISFIFFSVPQVFPKFFHNFLSVKIRVSGFGHRTYLTARPDSKGSGRTYLSPWPDMSGPLPYLRLTQPIQLLGQIPEAFSGHVRLSIRTCPT